MTGGAGADVFRYIAPTDTDQSGATADRITDFSHAQGDKIDLSEIDWDRVGGNGDQAFIFWGEFDPSNPTVAGDVSYAANTTGPGIFVFFDYIELFTGAHRFSTIAITNVSSVEASDFVL